MGITRKFQHHVTFANIHEMAEWSLSWESMEKLPTLDKRRYEVYRSCDACVLPKRKMSSKKSKLYTCHKQVPPPSFIRKQNMNRPTDAYPRRGSDESTSKRQYRLHAIRRWNARHQQAFCVHHKTTSQPSLIRKQNMEIPKNADRRRVRRRYRHSAKTDTDYALCFSWILAKKKLSTSKQSCAYRKKVSPSRLIRKHNMERQKNVYPRRVVRRTNTGCRDYAPLEWSSRGRYPSMRKAVRIVHISLLMNACQEEDLYEAAQVPYESDTTNALCNEDNKGGKNLVEITE